MRAECGDRYKRHLEFREMKTSSCFFHHVTNDVDKIRC